MHCPPLTITFLGTGTSSGVPMIGCDCDVCSSKNKKDKRLRSSILIQSSKTSLVVDTGPDFRYQMLREKVKHIDAIVFTHPHKDHIAGLDDIRAFNFFSKQPMQLYANSLTEEAIRRDFYYAFSDSKYPGIPEITLNIIDLTPFYINDIPVKPILGWHLKMPVLGFRFGKFTYMTDVNKIDEGEKEKIRGSEVFVINALRKEKHISHYTLYEAVQLANELDIPQTYCTHISHQMGMHDDINKTLPQHVQLAFDGLKVNMH